MRPLSALSRVAALLGFFSVAAFGELHAEPSDPGSSERRNEFARMITQIAGHHDLKDTKFTERVLGVTLVGEPYFFSFTNTVQGTAYNPTKNPVYLDEKTLVTYRIPDKYKDDLYIADLMFSFLDRSFCLSRRDLDRIFLPTFPRSEEPRTALFWYTAYTSGGSRTRISASTRTDDDCIDLLQVSEVKPR